MFSSFYGKLIEYKVCSRWYLKRLVWRCNWKRFQWKSLNLNGVTSLIQRNETFSLLKLHAGMLVQVFHDVYDDQNCW